jgi:hypothetical protein
MRLDGTLEDYPLSDILQLIFMGNRSGTLHLYSGGDEGSVVVGEGLVKCGKTSKLSGLKAVRTILGWRSGKFIFDTEELAELGDETRIDLPIQQFILDLSAEMDESKDLMDKVGGPDRRLMLVPLAPQAKPVTLSPVQWQVVVHVGDAPTLAELQGRLALSERDLLRVIVDLRDRGLLTIE